MADGPVRIVLLARAGDAREQLRKALTELGAVLVAEGDPAELDPAALMSPPPDAVMVSLEPAIEDALDRFDAMLSAPGVEVMYDDAEVTRQLDGWDLARWARHLASKLVGSDLLPPVPDQANRVHDFDISPQPGAPPTPAELMDGARLEDYAAEASSLVDGVPMTPSLTTADSLDDAGSMSLAHDAAMELGEMSLDMDLGDIEQALQRMDQETAKPSAAAAPDEFMEDGAFSLDVDLDGLDRSLASSDADAGHAPAPDAGALLADLDFNTDTPVKFSNFSGGDDASPLTGMDDDVAALAAQLDAFESTDTREAPKDMEFAREEPAKSAPASKAAAASAPAAAASAATAAKASFGSLSLTPMDDDPLPPPSGLFSRGAGEPTPPPPMPIAKPAKVATMDLSLVDEESLLSSIAPAAEPSAIPCKGVVLVLAGLGGPDAVRQLLAALPRTLPVAVLIHQHLDTGKHDRLVGQLGKGSTMPVDLAAIGVPASGGRVAVLPQGVGIRRVAGELQYVAIDTAEGVVRALPAADSVIIVLSGTSTALLPAIKDAHATGARLLAQEPSACFDGAAAEAVVAAGGEAASPLVLAERLLARWA